MVSDDQLKIGDFGLATTSRPSFVTSGAEGTITSDDSIFESAVTKQCGTKLYTAPEIEDAESCSTFLNHIYTFCIHTVQI